MNKSSGFRTIEFVEVKCTNIERFYSFRVPLSVMCENGYISTQENVEKCTRCNGTGKIEDVRSVLE